MSWNDQISDVVRRLRESYQKTDHLPQVPPALIRYVSGHEDYNEYLRSGNEVMVMYNLATHYFAGKSMWDFATILDFGCGCGRLAQFLEKPASMFGCDVNRRLIEFCKKAILFGNFYQNDLLPPLIYRDELFDLVYCFSVFSHLRQDVEARWLDELLRIGARGCLYLITVQGDWMIEATLGVEADKAKASGFYYKYVHQRHNTNMDFPDYYEASYHTSDYIKKVWGEHFKILAVIKGDDPKRYLFGRASFSSFDALPVIRPMGQDLVIAEKVA
jgi:SAM-dependent methyltransferase